MNIVTYADLRPGDFLNVGSMWKRIASIETGDRVKLRFRDGSTNAFPADATVLAKTNTARLSV